MLTFITGKDRWENVWTGPLKHAKVCCMSCLAYMILPCMCAKTFLLLFCCLFWYWTIEHLSIIVIFHVKIEHLFKVCLSAVFLVSSAFLSRLPFIGLHTFLFPICFDFCLPVDFPLCFLVDSSPMPSPVSLRKQILVFSLLSGLLSCHSLTRLCLSGGNGPFLYVFVTQFLGSTFPYLTKHKHLSVPSRLSSRHGLANTEMQSAREPFGRESPTLSEAWE